MSTTEATPPRLDATPADRYELVNALTELARALGWRNLSASTSETVVTVTYTKPSP